MAQPIIGKDGFLFLDEDSNSVIDQITGKLPLSEELLDRWTKTIISRNRDASKGGFKYFFVIVPNKHCVYAEKLPDNIRLSEARAARQLKGRLGFVIEYPLEYLRSASKHYLYYKTDTHWNSLGALLFMNDFFKRLHLPPVNYTIREREITGDLGDKLSSPQTSMTVEAEINSTTSVKYDNGVKNIGHVIFYENINKNLPVGVIFGDSFFNNYTSLLSQYFSKLYFFHAPVYDKNILERLKPDIVINQNIERFVRRPHEASLRNRFYMKLATMPYSRRDEVIAINPVGEEISGIDYNLAKKFIGAIKNAPNEEIYKRLQAQMFTHPPKD